MNDATNRGASNMTTMTAAEFEAAALTFRTTDSAEVRATAWEALERDLRELAETCAGSPTWNIVARQIAVL
jgi:hypothetical protein